MADAAIRAVRVRVTGRVQGVGFRAWTRRQAERLGLDGWVRNEPDGAVAALIEGPPDAIAAMLARLHAGPPGARVDSVESVEAVSERSRGFRVDR